MTPREFTEMVSRFTKDNNGLSAEGMNHLINMARNILGEDDKKRERAVDERQSE